MAKTMKAAKLVMSYSNKGKTLATLILPKM